MPGFCLPNAQQMLEVRYNTVLCSSSGRKVSPGSEVDIYNRPGAKDTARFLMPASVRRKAGHCLGCTYRSLEATVELGEEGVVPGKGEDAFLCHGALNIIILENDILLQHLHCIQLPTLLHLGKHHLNQKGV